MPRSLVDASNTALPNAELSSHTSHFELVSGEVDRGLTRELLDHGPATSCSGKGMNHRETCRSRTTFLFTLSKSIANPPPFPVNQIAQPQCRPSQPQVKPQRNLHLSQFPTFSRSLTHAKAYQTARPQPPALVAPASYSPVLGMSTLAPSSSTLNLGHQNQARERRPRQRAGPISTALATYSANYERLRHNAQSTPSSNSTSSLVVRRARGRAQPSPALPSAYRRRNVPSVHETLVPAEDGAPPNCNILVLVYPPPEVEGEYRVFQTLHADFIVKLEEYNLAYRYTLPLDHKVNDLLRRVVTDMESSPAQYEFPVARRASVAASTLVTTLQLLGLWDSGRPHNTLGVHLRIEPHTLATNIGELLSNPNHFAGRTAVRDNLFIIRLAVMGRTLTGILPDGRRHGCIATRLNSLFPQDADSMGADAEGTSGGESDEEEEEVARQLWRHPRARRNTMPSPQREALRIALRAGRAVAAASLTRTPTPPVSPPIPATRPFTPPRSITPPPVDFALPRTMWDENAVFISRSQGTYGPDAFTRRIFVAATRGRTPAPMRIRGIDLDAATDEFEALIDACGERGDYTDLFTLDRGFALTDATAFGDGVEHEVRNNVFERFVKAGSAFLEPGEGGFMVPRTLFTGDSPIPIPAPRLAAWKRFGVICGLLFVAGNLPPTISPAVFQYLIHNCNFHSLHPAFIGEWYPELRALILSWLAMDPADQNLAAYDSQFINFHNVSASAFRIRDLATHLALAVTMLFRAVLGQTGYSQEELQYFRTGFQLRCGNGFTLPAAIRNFEGGSEPFLCLTATSHISSADSVLTHLNVVTPANFLPLLGALQTLTNDITLTFDMLVERYLRGVGTPCPQRFAGARDAFHPIIDLSKITTRAFRARCLVWAATGTPFLDPGVAVAHLWTEGLILARQMHPDLY
ncbi:hypothetical protein C8R46DRAFT_1040490 [Mycena filopes]|nr:hypothetical protein C8R46DRAFT_1040490 [Mycena filopes]